MSNNETASHNYDDCGMMPFRISHRHIPVYVVNNIDQNAIILAHQKLALCTIMALREIKNIIGPLKHQTKSTILLPKTSLQ